MRNTFYERVIASNDTQSPTPPVQLRPLMADLKSCVCIITFMVSVLSSSLGVNDIGAEGMESLCTSASYFSSLTSLE